VIRSKNVILRQVREADLDEYIRLVNDYLARGDYWPTGLMAEVKTRNEFQETGWWDPDRGTLLITDLKDKMLGRLFFWKPVSYMDAFELGGMIFEPEGRGKGVMSEALPMLLAYLFDTKRVDRLQATHLPGNEASKKVLMRAGMTYEGTLRRAVFHRGQTEDLLMYSILRGEVPGLNELLSDNA
jgi:ribosomal-protein-alanine N-acetyltransferase